MRRLNFFNFEIQHDFLSILSSICLDVNSSLPQVSIMFFQRLMLALKETLEVKKQLTIAKKRENDGNFGSKIYKIMV